MIENYYLENMGSMVGTALFYIFIASIVLLTILLILSLLFLILGCLIKSQTVKAKCLRASITILIILLCVLTTPYIVLTVRNLI